MAITSVRVFKKNYGKAEQWALLSERASILHTLVDAHHTSSRHDAFISFFFLKQPGRVLELIRENPIWFFEHHRSVRFIINWLSYSYSFLKIKNNKDKALRPSLEKQKSKASLGQRNRLVHMQVDLQTDQNLISSFFISSSSCRIK